MAEEKTPADSAVTTRYQVMPEHANPHRAMFGGVLMAWIDSIAAMAAERHCGRVAVTASIDSLVFKRPIYVGDHVVLKASVNYVGTTSMEVGVTVWSENPINGDTRKCTSAFLTFVALDDDERPTNVPRLRMTTMLEQRRWENARMRVAHRKKLLKDIAARRELDEESLD